MSRYKFNLPAFINVLLAIFMVLSGYFLLVFLYASYPLFVANLAPVLVMLWAGAFVGFTITVDKIFKKARIENLAKNPSGLVRQGNSIVRVNSYTWIFGQNKRSMSSGSIGRTNDAIECTIKLSPRRRLFIATIKPDGLFFEKNDKTSGFVDRSYSVVAYGQGTNQIAATQ